MVPVDVAVVDPVEPPLPPHITFEQARHFAESMVREPSGVGIATEAIKEKVRELVPGR